MIDNKPNLPSEGSQVSAMTYSSVEYDTMSKKVSGKLSTFPSPFGGMPQCFVDGMQVDPASVKQDAASTDSAASESRQDAQQGSPETDAPPPM